MDKNPAVEGALFLKEITNAAAYYGFYNYGNYSQNHTLGFDAAKSSKIYGASTTVQPPAISLIPQIKF